MSTRERRIIRIGGHEIPIVVTPDEHRHVERAAKAVNDQIAALSDKAGGIVPPQKVAAMVAFQMAFDLSVADEQLGEAEKLRDELLRQREAVSRLEKLLGRVDDALAY